MKVYVFCQECNIYYNKIDYFFAMSKDWHCEECGRKMKIAPEFFLI